MHNGVDFKVGMKKVSRIQINNLYNSKHAEQFRALDE